MHSITVSTSLSDIDDGMLNGACNVSPTTTGGAGGTGGKANLPVLGIAPVFNRVNDPCEPSPEPPLSGVDAAPGAAGLEEPERLNEVSDPLAIWHTYWPT